VGLGGGGFRVLACADTGSETPLGVCQYFLSLSFSLLGSLLFSQKEVSYGFEILHGLISNKNIRIPTPKNFWGTPPFPQIMVYLGGQILKSCPRVRKFCMRPKVTKILRFHPPNFVGDPPYPRIMVYFGGQILKSFPRVLKFCMRP
jgi:hypothetical protein